MINGFIIAFFLLLFGFFLFIAWCVFAVSQKSDDTMEEMGIEFNEYDHIDGV